MKIRKPIKGYKTIDIGPLDFYEKILCSGPGMRRVILWRHVICWACRGRFEPDDVMILGFKKHGLKGVPQCMRFHERCWDGTGKPTVDEKAEAGEEA